jgi:hypothetical protein
VEGRISLKQFRVQVGFTRLERAMQSRMTSSRLMFQPVTMGHIRAHGCRSRLV